MDLDSAQAIVLALLAGWIGYAVGGRRWRQQERRTLYRDYLIAAHDALAALHAFEEEWNKNPTKMPNRLYYNLLDKSEKAEWMEQELRLIAPWKVCNAATISGSIDSLLTEIVYDEDLDDYENRQPPSYEWFHSRRHTYLWGPDVSELDEFVNLARADLGAQSRFWRIRGQFISYRTGFPGWLKWQFIPRLPLVGRKFAHRNNRKFEDLVRRREEEWKAGREMRRQLAHPKNASEVQLSDESD
jgi:hypothetical protein